jgi:uncharacterized protein (DUF488 family)
VNIYTIGFTKKPASAFFGLLRKSGARTLVDVRLNNVSQLAGFAKRDDLKYFLAELCDMDYVHDRRLAPTQTMLDDYRKRGATWSEYARQFLDLMAERQIESNLSPGKLDNSVLLCSEPEPRNCHRRLVTEYLAEHWDDVTIEHL